MGARWAIPMAARLLQMTTDPALILTQWLSPSYPVGAYTYSHGLEMAVEDGAVKRATTSSPIWIRTTRRRAWCFPSPEI